MAALRHTSFNLRDNGMKTYARWLFGFSTALNVAVGLAILFLRPLIAGALGLSPIAGTNLVLVNFAGAMIVLFGYGYLRIAMDPVYFRPLIHVQAIGKLLAFVCAAVPWLMGAIPARLPLLLLGDVVLALLFLDYLRRSRWSA